jgi:hypothetical protein
MCDRGGCQESLLVSGIGVRLSGRPGFEIDIQGCWKQRRHSSKTLMSLDAASISMHLRHARHVAADEIFRLDTST